MKKTIITIFFLCFAAITNAQSSDINKANKYFERAFYAEAIPIYENVLEDKTTMEAVQKLADSYYYLYNMPKANRYYKYLVGFYGSQISDEYYFKYIHTLKAINKHDKANEVLKGFYIKKNDKKNLEKLNESIKYLENIKAIGNRYQIKNLAINTENSEFGAINQNDKIIFSASKKEKKLFEKSYRWNRKPYLDLYETPIDKIHLGDSIVKSISANINTKVHEANAIFTKDGKTVYFTRNNFIKNKRNKDKKNITHLQIFRGELINGEWTNIQSLPFNHIDYSTEHPALSNDEKTLYFASDMSGGFGSFDIYEIAILADGDFGKPKNLGKNINTDKKEQFPFISKNNELYFSSNGLPGFGSLDVFISKSINNQFSKPDNVGLPINSGYDDFAFNINTDTKEGYFSSNRPSGKGSDDIYKVSERKPLIIEECEQSIAVLITDIDTKEVLENATILIKKGFKTLNEVKTDSVGKFRFNTECKLSYTLVASKNGYLQEQKILIIDNIRHKNNKISIALKSLKQIEKEKEIALQIKKEKELKLKLIAEQKVKLKKKNKIEKIIASEKSIEKNNDRLFIKTADINFDYKLWYLRKDAKTAVNKVIALMKKHPKMVVEIGTHSDIRGHNQYNLNLSQKRANSVREYFIEKGIQENRISAVGYGETQPIIKCKTEDSCTEEQHELNRRCEFIVKKIE
ncbi:OmpA family protein [Polaribacter sp. Hel1_85]|uniref:OmpA family protein n=1 Tax=Polaribacter sp. Hel1_85 TaxID=1250005 RepID=UPI00052D7AF5|nr:OmpA family protein [Polaribacter sp. Hel1_85]KGL62807.1 OmpA/MotB family outer membrane protein [Polaribacter sp. Hel1_85]